jgi:hypothetical protein
VNMAVSSRLGCSESRSAFPLWSSAPGECAHGFSEMQFARACRAMLFKACSFPLMLLMVPRHASFMVWSRRVDYGIFFSLSTLLCCYCKVVGSFCLRHLRAVLAGCTIFGIHRDGLFITSSHAGVFLNS